MFNNIIIVDTADDNTALATADTTASAADKGAVTIVHPCVLRQIQFLVTTNIVNTTTAAVESVDYRPTYGSDTGRVELGTLVLANGTAAGKVVYKNVNKKLSPGEQLVCRHKTAGAGGSAAGAGRFRLILEPISENPLNLSNMVASA